MSKLPVGILLAAGQSSRFGSNKMSHPVHNNIPMIIASASRLVEVLSDSIVVIRQDMNNYVTQLKELGLRVVINEQANRGMGTSIACGVRASPDAEGWLIALADMPYIKTETLAQLKSRLESGANIVAPFYEQKRGHPVGFNQRYKDELIALNDDVGARYIIEKNKSQLEIILTNDAGVIRDIDLVSDIR